MTQYFRFLILAFLGLLSEPKSIEVFSPDAVLEAVDDSTAHVGAAASLHTAATPATRHAH